MKTASARTELLQSAWRALRHKLVPPCGLADCVHRHALWRWLGIRTPQVSLDGARYCLNPCLERALVKALPRGRFNSRRVQGSHRIPLGLLLVSKNQLTTEQLRSALDAQRAAGRGRLGEWLRRLGFLGEPEITAALARQWSCPVLRDGSSLSRSRHFPQLPFALLESFAMLPVDYVAATSTLHLVFGEGVDHSVLYAIETMTGCHTEPCMADSSFVRAHLEELAGHRSETEVVFEWNNNDGADFSGIIRSYCARLRMDEIQLADCNGYLWARLSRNLLPPVDLLMRTPPFPSFQFPASDRVLAV